VAGDPLARGQAPQHALVEPPRLAVIDVLDAGGALEPGRLEPLGLAPVLPPGPLGIDQEPEPLLEAELGIGGLAALLLPGGHEAAQVQRLELLNRWGV